MIGAESHSGVFGQTLFDEAEVTECQRYGPAGRNREEQALPEFVESAEAGF